MNAIDKESLQNGNRHLVDSLEKDEPQITSGSSESSDKSFEGNFQDSLVELAEYVKIHNTSEGFKYSKSQRI